MIIIVKLIAVAIAIFSIIKSYLDFRRHRESFVMFSFWGTVWAVAAGIIVYPGIIDQIISLSPDQTLTVGSMIALAFVFMLYIVYRVYAKAARIEYQLSELVRGLSLSKEFIRQPKKK